MFFCRRLYTPPPVRTLHTKTLRRHAYLQQSCVSKTILRCWWHLKKIRTGFFRQRRLAKFSSSSSRPKQPLSNAMPSPPKQQIIIPRPSKLEHKRGGFSSHYQPPHSFVDSSWSQRNHPISSPPPPGAIDIETFFFHQSIAHCVRHSPAALANFLFIGFCLSATKSSNKKM